MEKRLPEGVSARTMKGRGVPDGYRFMSSDQASRTSATLLGRLRAQPDDEQAWDRFVECYGPQIYNWCRQWALQQADAEDVTQNVLLRLATKLRTFTYDPKRSFRGWLRTVTRNALSD